MLPMASPPGFRCGTNGLAGGAIYFATSEADARRKSNNGHDVVLRCELTMGRVCELDHNGCPSMTLQRLKQMGYDSVKIRRNGDEYVVYEPSRVRLLVDSDGKNRQNPPCEFPRMASTCKLCGSDFVQGPWPHANRYNTGEYCSRACADEYTYGDAAKERWRQEEAARCPLQRLAEVKRIEESLKRMGLISQSSNLRCRLLVGEFEIEFL
jgi:hypothetical protein